MAAHKQGQFWPMHDKLFQDTKKLEDTDFETYATELGLNVEQFKVDMASPEVAAIVKRHDESCVSIGASGTPAFFVNGRKLSGAKPFEEFKTVIDEELKKAKALLAEGVSVQNLYAEVLKRGQNATKAAKPSQLADRSVIIDTRDCPADGPAEAVAELVIFSDFQCPFCSRIVEPVHDARKTLGDQLRVVFKQMPLDRIHPRARPAAIASLAAHRQGKFWPYHDLLFKNTKKLGDADFLKYAKRLGLDLARFKADLADPKLAAQVQRDVEHAGRLGVTGTPSVFLNGRRMKSPPTSASALVDIVNTEVLGL